MAELRSASTNAAAQPVRECGTGRLLAIAAVVVSIFLSSSAADAQDYRSIPPTSPAPPQPAITVPMQSIQRPSDAGFQPQILAARGDLLDPWCKSTTTAVNAAVCSDDDLRALAIERLRAFDQARSRLTWDQQKSLAADQNGWASSLPRTCGFAADAKPPLPLAPEIKACLLRQGRLRLTYLQTYGATPGTDTSAAANAVAPQKLLPSTPPPPPRPSASSPQVLPSASAPHPTPSQLVAGALPPWVTQDKDAKNDKGPP